LRISSSQESVEGSDIKKTSVLPRSQLVDGVVVVNYIIDLVKRLKYKCLLLKVDFKKAH